MGLCFTTQHDVKVSDSKKSSTLCCVPVEKPSSARGVTPSFASSAAVFQRVGLLFTFLSDVLFREVPDLVESLGTPLWWGVPSESSPSSSSALGAPSLTSLECTADISAFLSLAESTEGGCVHSLVQLLHASLPGSLQELKAYGAVTSAAKELEASLVSRRCIGVSPPSHAGGSGLHSALATFGADVHTRFVYKRRQVVLGEARDICANEYHNSTPVPDVVHLISSTGLSGVSTLPAPDPEGIAAACASDVNVEKFQVSETVIRVLQLVHDTLKEACELPPGCVSVLYDTARDVVDVFRAVVPALFGPIIKSVPRLAMLFHNDCLFLGQRLGSVGQQYRSRLPPPLSSMASMADLVPAFRRLAEDTFVTQIKRQLVEITTTGPPPDLTLDDLVRREVFEEVEAGVKRQLYHLSQLAAQWSAVLQPRVR